MSPIILLSDETADTARAALLEVLITSNIELFDAGSIPLRGASESEVVAAIEWHVNELTALRARLLVLISQSGTSFSMFVNKSDNAICLADSPALTITEVMELGANAIEVKSTRNMREVGELIVDVLRNRRV